jgi:hypothetical protein
MKKPIRRDFVNPVRRCGIIAASVLSLGIFSQTALPQDIQAHGAHGPSQRSSQALSQGIFTLNPDQLSALLRKPLSTLTPDQLRSVQYTLQLTQQASLDMQITMTQALMLGLGSLLSQPLSEASRDHQPALAQGIKAILEETRRLLTDYIPFGHVLAAHAFFFPWQAESVDLGRFPSLAALDQPAGAIDPEILAFARELLESIASELHILLIETFQGPTSKDPDLMHSAQQIFHLLFAATPENQMRAGYFAFHLNWLTLNFFSQVKTHFDALIRLKTRSSSQEQLLSLLATTRETLGKWAVGLPGIFELMMLQVSAPLTPSLIQTSAHACLMIGEEDFSRLFITDLWPLGLDGTQAWLEVLADPTSLKDYANFNDYLLKTPPEGEEPLAEILVQFWATYLYPSRTFAPLGNADPEDQDQLRENLEKVCSRFPRGQDSKDNQDASGCFETYLPSTPLEAFLAVVVLELWKQGAESLPLPQGTVQGEKLLDAWQVSTGALEGVWQDVIRPLLEKPSVLGSVQGSPTQPLKTQLTQFVALPSLKTVMLQHYLETVDGHITYHRRSEVTEDDTTLILSDEIQGLKAGETLETDAIPPSAGLGDDTGKVPVLKLNKTRTLANLLSILVPGGSSTEVMKSPSTETWAKALKDDLDALGSTVLGDTRLWVPALNDAFQELSRTPFPATWDLKWVVQMLSSTVQRNLISGLQAYLDVVRHPSTKTLPVLGSVLAGQDGLPILTPDTLPTWLQGIEKSWLIPIRWQGEQSTESSLVFVYLSASECNSSSAPTLPAQSQLPFVTLSRNLDSLLGEDPGKAPTDAQRQVDLLSGVVIPKTDHYLIAAQASLEHQRFALPLMPLSLVEDVQRGLRSNREFRRMVQEEGLNQKGTSLLDTLVEQALDSPSLGLKPALFDAYRDPASVSFYYKDLWWKIPMVEFPTQLSHVLENLLTHHADILFREEFAEQNLLSKAMQAVASLVDSQGRMMFWKPKQVFWVGHVLRSALVQEMDRVLEDPGSKGILGFFQNLVDPESENPALAYADEPFREIEWLNHVSTLSALQVATLSDRLAVAEAHFETHPQVELLRHEIVDILMETFRSPWIFAEGLKHGKSPKLRAQVMQKRSGAFTATLVDSNRTLDAMNLMDGLMRLQVLTLIPEHVELLSAGLSVGMEPLLDWTRRLLTLLSSNTLPQGEKMIFTMTRPGNTQALSNVFWGLESLLDFSGITDSPPTLRITASKETVLDHLTPFIPQAPDQLLGLDNTVEGERQ